MQVVKRFLLVLIGCMALVLFVNCEPVLLVEKEPNNTAETALYLTDEIAEGEISPAGDKDYWKIRLQDGYTYTFNLSKLQDDLQLMIYIYPNAVSDWSSTPLSAELRDASGTANEIFTITASDNSWLQLLVEGSNSKVGDETSRYRLQWERQ